MINIVKMFQEVINIGSALKIRILVEHLKRGQYCKEDIKLKVNSIYDWFPHFPNTTISAVLMLTNLIIE